MLDVEQVTLALQMPIEGGHSNIRLEIWHDQRDGGISDPAHNFAQSEWNLYQNQPIILTPILFCFLPDYEDTYSENY